MLLELNVTSTERLAGLAACAAGFLLLTWLLFRRFGHYRLIADTPTALIRSAPQGYVEISGHIVAGEGLPLRAPLSDRECVWYRIRVDQYQRNSNGRGGRWSSVHRATSTQWLQIDDGSGVCLVDPEGAQVISEYKRTWFGHTPNPNPNAYADTFRAYAGAILNAGSSRYRYTEELIFAHERLYALGRFRSVGGGRDRLDLKRVSGDILRSWKGDNERLLQRFDRNGDGRIDLQEWDEARRQALDEAGVQQTRMDRLPTLHLLGDPRQEGQPYLLSTYPESKLLARYRWTMAGLLLGLSIAVWLGLELLATAPV